MIQIIADFYGMTPTDPYYFIVPATCLVIFTLMMVILHNFMMILGGLLGAK